MSMKQIHILLAYLIQSKYVLHFIKKKSSNARVYDLQPTEQPRVVAFFLQNAIKSLSVFTCLQL